MLLLPLSYLDLHLEIDSEVLLRTKLYDKRDDFNFPIVNIPFICSNFPAAPAYGVDTISHRLWFLSRFLDTGMLLTKGY